MSKLVPNVVDTARLYRGKEFLGAFSAGRASICLTSRALAFEVHKQEPTARFFADKAMIAWAGGPWFIQEFKSQLEEQLYRLRRNLLIVQLGNIEAKDLFSYRTCNVALKLDHETRPNPVALQIIQKAELFAIVDEVLERMFSTL